MANKISQSLIAQVKTEFVTSKELLTQRDLAAKYELSLPTINKYSQEEKWEEARKQYWEEVSKSALEKAQADHLARIKDVNQSHYDTWELMHTKLKLSLLTATKSSDLSNLSAVLERIQKGQRLALGLDKQENVTQEQLIEALREFSKSVQAPKEFVESLFEEEDDTNGD